jgi:hypothetical protein
MNDNQEFNLDFFKKGTWTDNSLKNIYLNNLPEYSHYMPMEEGIANQDEIWNGGGRGNNHGFRDYHFNDCADILAAGCSFTWGAGLYEKDLWPNHIKNMTGKTVHNIGVSGGSIHGTVSRIFSYIRKYGKPKIVICLFPDALRSFLPLIPDRLTHSRLGNDILRHSFENKKQPMKIDTGWNGWSDETKSYFQPLYSKMPHHLNDIIPIEVAFYLSMQHIHMLEQYCDAADIKLVWGTWHSDTRLFFEKIKSLADDSYFKYYIDLEETGQYSKHVENETLPDYQCHNELKMTDKETYWMAADKHHWGSHSQIHIAEEFYKQIKNINI